MEMSVFRFPKPEKKEDILVPELKDVIKCVPVFMLYLCEPKSSTKPTGPFLFRFCFKNLFKKDFTKVPK